MCVKYGYKECMEACIEYAENVFQAEEEEAIVYCRRTCLPLKRKVQKDKLAETKKEKALALGL